MSKKDEASNKRDRWPYSGKDSYLNTKEGHRKYGMTYIKCESEKDIYGLKAAE